MGMGEDISNQLDNAVRLIDEVRDCLHGSKSDLWLMNHKCGVAIGYLVDVQQRLGYEHSNRTTLEKIQNDLIESELVEILLNAKKGGSK